MVPLPPAAAFRAARSCSFSTAFLLCHSPVVASPVWHPSPTAGFALRGISAPPPMQPVGSSFAPKRKLFDGGQHAHAAPPGRRRITPPGSGGSSSSEPDWEAARECSGRADAAPGFRMLLQPVAMKQHATLSQRATPLDADGISQLHLESAIAPRSAAFFNIDHQPDTEGDGPGCGARHYSRGRSALESADSLEPELVSIVDSAATCPRRPRGPGGPAASPPVSPVDEHNFASKTPRPRRNFAQKRAFALQPNDVAEEELQIVAWRAKQQHQCLLPPASMSQPEELPEASRNRRALFHWLINVCNQRKMLRDTNGRPPLGFSVPCGCCFVQSSTEPNGLVSRSLTAEGLLLAFNYFDR